MKPHNHNRLTACVRHLGFLAAMMFSVASANADPIEMPERSITPEITFLIGFSILLEATCILVLLRRFRKPRLFILWLLGLHLFTYPAFLGFLWRFQDMRPAFAVAIGEGLIMLIEGSLIYCLCRFLPPAKPGLATASVFKCWLASIIGNACSAAAFPLFLTIYEHIAPS
jgi:hypothetical protein